jgi:ABC-2 type transport system permease protein
MKTTTQNARINSAGTAVPERGPQLAVSNLAAVRMLVWREWVRFFRQRNRLIGALGQPILFWILFGTGMHSAFRGGDQDFMTYYLPGTIVLILLFTAIFATISIIEDRREGFLQNVLVAPVSRWTIAAGKIVGGGAIAWVQAMLFVALAVSTGSLPLGSGLLGAALMMAVCSLALTALGVCFAWPMESTQGFHAIMNLVLMPMWLLSGAFFPIPHPGIDGPVGQWIMHWLMRLNPLSYSIAGLRRMLDGAVPSTASASDGLWLPSLTSSWSVSLGFLVLTCGLAWWVVLRPAKGDLK